MKTTLNPDFVKHIHHRLASDNAQAAKPGPSDRRQPVHTVYGGAHLFSERTIRRLGEMARQAFTSYAPDAITLCRALGLDYSQEQAQRLHDKVGQKLASEAVEDFRIDFEDGFGNRPDEEEDATAIKAAQALAHAMQSNDLSPFIGIRIKPFNDELKARSIRTLDLFLSTLIGKTKQLPDGFTVTLPKITHPGQVTALAEIMDTMEPMLGLQNGALCMELMVETPESIFDQQGACALPTLVTNARGRCRGAHFGTYDYTASMDITAAWQSMDHPACDFARHVMKVTLAGTGVLISDGATNVMPVGPHRSEQLTNTQLQENQDVVHAAWKLAFDHTRHSLRHGIYQGWDLHPAQFVARYAAVFSFFLESKDAATTRLRNFMDTAAKATLSGDVFDDAATGQGLLNFFLRAFGCGAIDADELLATGLSEEEFRTRSFLKILQMRRTL
ncbi:MAG: phosphoenolpyruvate kinase [Acidobacteria bacterium]|nr:phosphoenolpyruvate kinase [Acidobacteriota bacterium]